LLTIFRAPTNFLWLTAIVVAEYGWVLILITLALLCWGMYGLPYKMTGNILGIITIILLLSPIIRAAIISHNLSNEMIIALHIKKENKSLFEKSPFSFFKLFTVNEKLNYRTLTYQQSDKKDYKLDFYSSTIEGKKPCVIVVHGGSWSSGDSQQLPELNSYLANKGYHVASINYHLAPDYLSPRPVEDVRLAIDYLKINAEKLNIDTNNFVLIGRSAGAQIALMAAYTLDDKSIKGVVDLYGPADMVWGYSLPTNPLIMDSRKVMEDYLGGTIDEVPMNYKNSSAVDFVNKSTPPTLMIHGKNDVLVAYEHSHRLELKLKNAGVKYYWLKLPWATHGFDYNLRGPGGQLSTYAIEVFLYNVTNN
jgi:acetyl esterase/lipase